MIIRGRSRGRPAELAEHLARLDTNERLEVLQIRGTVADTVLDSLREMMAVAAGTACTKALYHASLSTRAHEHLSVDQWIYAAAKLEQRLGLDEQPRVIVQHLKKNREHLHVVWSRIDPRKMSAVPDSHNYRAHEEVARQLEREFGHERVQGALVERDGERPLRTPYVHELQQAARTGIDIARVTTEVTKLWRQPEAAATFAAGLKGLGYQLAIGDRRTFVIIDQKGGVHSLARRVEGARTADIKERLADIDALPTVAEARGALRENQRSDENSKPVDRTRTSGGAEPRAVLENLFRTPSYATMAEIERAAEGALPDRQSAMAELLREPDLVSLHRPTGELVGYTTKAIRAEELAAMALARKLNAGRVKPFSAATIDAVIAQQGLSADQEQAVRLALSGSQLTLITGRAGTGKSHVHASLWAVAAAEKRPVFALAPTHTVVADMQDAGYARTNTIHSFLWYRQHAPDHATGRIERNALVVVDEIGMVSTHHLLQLMRAVPASASIVMMGDDRQLGSIQRGGIFADLVAALGGAELTTFRRQERHWARAASRAFAEYRFLDGLEAYAERDLIHWSPSLDASRTALLARYEADTRNAGLGKKFIFAYTNQECRKLNRGAQAIHIARGGVQNLHTFETERGKLRVGEGDRVAFRATDKRRGILNGAMATVEKIEENRLTTRTDRGRVVKFDISEFSALELGYAGTIYRGQGKTLDDVYLLHTRHWRDAASYVALTRSRRTTRIFVARDQATNVSDLARQMGRQTRRESTLQYLTSAELQQMQQQVVEVVEKAWPQPTNQRGATRTKDRFLER